MLTALLVMTMIQLLPQLRWTHDWWMRTFKTEIFWPWYTLIGTVVTLLTAFAVRGFSSDQPLPDSGHSVRSALEL